VHSGRWILEVGGQNELRIVLAAVWQLAVWQLGSGPLRPSPSQGEVEVVGARDGKQLRAKVDEVDVSVGARNEEVSRIYFGRFLYRSIRSSTIDDLHRRCHSSVPDRLCRLCCACLHSAVLALIHQRIYYWIQACSTPYRDSTTTARIETVGKSLFPESRPVRSDLRAETPCSNPPRFQIRPGFLRKLGGRALSYSCSSERRLSTITVEENRKRLELALPHGLGLCGMGKP